MFRKLFSSVAIQSLGTLSSFLAIWLITKYLGVSKQGEFALLKSWIDFLVVLASFGFAQSFIYVINTLNTSRGKLKKFSIIYPLFVLVLSSFITYIWFRHGAEVRWLVGIDYVLIGITVACLVGHKLLRGIFLTINDGKLFALISILPAICLFGLILFKVLTATQYSLALLYVVSGIFSFLIMIILVKDSSGDGQPIPWKPVLLNGNSIFLQGVALTLLPMSTYWLMSYYGMNNQVIGGFNIAIYFYQAFALPLNMVAPIFFNRWSKISDTSILLKELKYFLWIGLPILPISVLIGFLLKYIVPYVFSQELVFAIPSMQLLLSAGILIYVTNLLSCMNLALGIFANNTASYVIKIIVSIILVFISLNFFPGRLELIALAWLLGDVLLLIILFIVLYRRITT